MDCLLQYVSASCPLASLGEALLCVRPQTGSRLASPVGEDLLTGVAVAMKSPPQSGALSCRRKMKMGPFWWDFNMPLLLFYFLVVSHLKLAFPTARLRDVYAMCLFSSGFLFLYKISLCLELFYLLILVRGWY